MNKYLVVSTTVISVLISLSASAAPGEYWEVTTKTEMPGMPFQMPAMKQKVCVAKGGENNPENTSGDKSCKMTDIKTAGNKTTWKVRCERSGQVTSGSGEQTTSANSYSGKMQFTSGGKGGQGVEMTSVYSGKRVGGNCETQ